MVARVQFTRLMEACYFEIELFPYEDDRSYDLVEYGERPAYWRTYPMDVEYIGEYQW